MEKEDLKKLFEKLKEVGVIENYKELSRNTIKIFTLDDEECYISFNKEGKLEENDSKAEAIADILEKEQELQELKKHYEEEYGKNF